MRKFPTLRFVAALIATNLKSSFALRASFWLSVLFMAANNLIFFAMWWILFDRFQEIGGWRIGDMLALFGVVATGYGLAVIFGGGVRDLARTIIEGDLDAVMTQPKDVLLHVVASRSSASGWGDVGSGIGMLVAATWQRPEVLGLAIPAVLASASVLLATGVIIHSLAFWLGPLDTLARQLWEFTLTFSVYPSSIFSGGLKLVLFTLIPAGFIGHLPAALVRAPSWGAGIGAGAGAVIYAAVALGVFRLGLRRYASGNRFGGHL